MRCLQIHPHTSQRVAEPGQHEAVVENRRDLCEEHGLVRLAVTGSFGARAGQFIQILCRSACSAEPYLRRPFSIAALEHVAGRALIDIVYRVVGPGTEWLDNLVTGDGVDILGPLGNGFELCEDVHMAYLVSGGVGHPPVQMLARELERRGIRRVAFHGARTKGLFALTMERDIPGKGTRAETASGVREWEDSNTPVVLASDDGSVGYHGNVVEAMDTYHCEHGTNTGGLAIFACGPIVMLEAVSSKAAQWGVPCRVAMETLMGCGMGTCQSCVIPVRSGRDPAGWEYRLCCMDGPVFEAQEIVWSRMQTG